MAIQPANPPINNPTFKQAKIQLKSNFVAAPVTIKTGDVVKLGTKITTIDSPIHLATISVYGLTFNLGTSNSGGNNQATTPRPTVGHVYPIRRIR